MKLPKKIKSVGLCFVAILGIFIAYASLIPPAASADFTDQSDGTLTVTLSQTPKTTTKVTMTRAAPVPAANSGNGKEIAPQTITLSGGCTTGQTRRCSATTYSSGTIPYSGYSNAPTGCHDDSYVWQTWNIKVSGGATGTGQIHIPCGGGKTLAVNVTLASQANSVGTIKGVAFSDSGKACNSNSEYILTGAGQGGGSYDIPANAGSPLSIDSSGNYIISNVKPGQYDLVIDCVYAQDGNVVGQSTVLRQQNITVTAGETTSIDINKPSSGDAGSSCGTDANGNAKNCNDATLDCGAGAWNWLICSGINVLQGAAEKLDNFITSQLDINTGKIFNSTNTPAYQSAWNNFRVLATALLVIAGLVMVASQALGFEILDAYTIRKVLPRLLVAIIGISLSWPLLQLVINFFDVVGYDVRSLIYAPFNAMAQSGGTTSLVLLGNPLTLLAAGSALWLAFGPAIFTFLITAFLALMIAFLILVVRQIAVVVLVILAPVAIACYVLPNTQKVWKLWSENFLGLMLMFPIISALIAAGHVFSAVGRTGSTFEQFVAIVAYFIPYFMLPFAFRLATGALGTLSGMVNDKGKGAFDRLKGIRSNASQKNFGKMKAGNRFSDRNAITRSINRSTVAAGTGMQGRFGMGKRGAQAIDQARRGAAMEQVMKSAAFAAIQHDDGALMAATYDSAAAARAGLAAKGVKANDVDRYVAAAQASIGFGRPQAIAAAQQLAATGTGYLGYDTRDANGNLRHVSALEEASQTIARASGGSSSTAASIAGNVNSETKRAGRFDLAPGFSALNDLVQTELGGTAAGGDAYHAASVKASRGVDTVTMLRGKPRQVEDLMQSLSQHAANQQAQAVDMRDMTPAGDARRAAANAEFIQTMGQLDQVNQQKTYGSQENQAFVNGAVTATSGLRGHLDTLRENPEYDRLYQQSSAPRINGNDPNAPQPDS